MTTERGTIIVEVFSDGGFPGSTVVEAIEWLQELLLTIPEEFRSSAALEVSGESDYDYGHRAVVNIEYRRPETDEEMGVRIRNERVRAAHEAERYERLATEARKRLEE